MKTRRSGYGKKKIKRSLVTRINEDKRVKSTGASNEQKIFKLRGPVRQVNCILDWTIIRRGINYSTFALKN